MRTDRSKYTNFKRSARFRTSLRDETVEIPAPPQPKTSLSKQNILLLFAPSIGLLVIGLVYGLMYRNFLMPIVMTIGAITYPSIMLFVRRQNEQKYKEELEEIERVYQGVLTDKKLQLEKLRKDQVKILNSAFPELSQLLSWTKEVSHRIWERKPQDDDFLVLRFAEGKTQPVFHVTAPKIDYIQYASSLEKDAHSLAEEYKKDVSGVPVTVNLVTVGALAITGSRNLIEPLARRLLCDLAVLHSPTEVELYAVIDAEQLGDWDWLKWLPHTRTIVNKGNRPQIAYGTQDSRQVLNSLFDELHTRSLGKGESIASRPHIVLFVQDVNLVSGHEAISRIIRDGSQLRASVIFLASSSTQAPDSCAGIIEVDSGGVKLKVTRGDEKPKHGKAEFGSLETCQTIARNLAKLNIEGAGGNLPSEARLLELLRLSDIDRVDFAGMWSDAWRSPPVLQAVLGVKQGKQSEILNLRQNAHGPHGLIAGTTRSGKSELLLTLLAGMAMSHHPHHLNFVLIDYKGGTSMAALEDLPHTVGVVTDLDGRQTTRALEALDSELSRREEILGQYRVADLDKFYERGYHRERVLPYLFIVIDEFAELRYKFRDELSIVMGKFISLAQRGGGLGIHLILAMQSPEGIVDDKIRANTRFRICLRVENAAESRSLLQKNDAYNLPLIPGRAYLQVGNDAVYDLFQVARVGGLYSKPGQAIAEKYEVYQIEADGDMQLILQSSPPDLPREQDQGNEQSGQSIETDVQAIVRKLRDAAEKAGIKKLDGPWPPPLKREVYLEPLFAREQREYWNGVLWPEVDAGMPKWMTAPIGLLDEPKAQRQDPLVLDLMGQDNNILVIGGPASGKTMFLLSLASSFAQLYNPQEINFHLVDFGGDQLRTAFEFLPHTAGVYSPTDTEKIQRLIYMLQQTLENRQRIFSKVGAQNLKVYLQSPKSQKLPVILILIDNFTSFRAKFPENNPIWVSLMRDGGKYGLCFVLTSDKLPGDDFMNQIRSRVALAMPDRTLYSSILGKRPDLAQYDGVPGRGFWKGDAPIQFQTALPAKGSPSDQINQLRTMADVMNTGWEGPRPEVLENLEDIVPFDRVVSDKALSTWQRFEVDRDLQIPIGLDYTTHEVVNAGLLQESPYFLVVGPARSGKTDALATVVLSTALHFSPTQVHFILTSFSADNKLENLKNLPHVLDYVTTEDTFNEALDHLLRIYAMRKGSQKTRPMSYRPKPVLFLVVDNYASLEKVLGINYAQQMLEVTRMGRELGIGLITAITANAMAKIHDSLLKAISQGQTGLWLRSMAMDSSLASTVGVRIPPDLRNKKDLPPGRGVLFSQEMERQPYLQVATCLTARASGRSIQDWVQLVSEKAAASGMKKALWEDYEDKIAE